MSASGDARRLIHSLAALGVRDAVLSPGSRSGPLAVGLLAAERAGVCLLYTSDAADEGRRVDGSGGPGTCKITIHVEKSCQT
ncbi:hypothetical protein AERO_18330, partial [Aeromicrobium fastidiosum]|uniref:hypothetical protein n=1 Tax=Aeromicrobium fastidiosum TaxID=52699 RepID=UPI00202375D6